MTRYGRFSRYSYAAMWWAVGREETLLYRGLSREGSRMIFFRVWAC